MAQASTILKGESGAIARSAIARIVATLALAMLVVSGCATAGNAGNAGGAEESTASTTRSSSGSADSDSDADTSASPSRVTSGVTATPSVTATTPAPPVAAAPVTMNDLLSAPVPSLCELPPGVLVNGDLPMPAGVTGNATIATDTTGGGLLVALGDLTGDGIDDGALVAVCGKGGVAWSHTVQVYTNGRTWLGGVNLRDVTGGSRDQVTAMSISGGVGNLDWKTNAPSDPACCPSVFMSGALRWNGTTVVLDLPQPAAAAAGSADPALYQFKENFAFTTPSGKFTCGMILTGSSYDLRTHAGCHGTTSPIPPKPERCVGQTWGKGLVVHDDGVPEFYCTGGVIYGRWDGVPTTVLEYGQSLTAGEFTCSVAESGVTCIHNPSGHGFTIAAASNSLF